MSSNPPDDYMEIGEVERLIRRREYLKALALLLKLRSQRVQHYSTTPILTIGVIHALCFADVKGDPKDEIIIGTEEGEIVAIDIDDDDEPKIWTKSIEGSVKKLQAGTTDLDEYDSILACSGSKQIVKLDKYGDIVEAFPIPNEKIDSIFISKQSQREVSTIGEILVGSEKNKIYMYDASLQTLLRSPILTSSSVDVLNALDPSSRNAKMIVTGSRDGYVHTFYLHYATHTVIDRWEYKTAGPVRAICAKDIDQDNSNEIIVGSEDGYVYVLSEDGKLKWRYYTREPIFDVDALDIDNNGHYEILLGVADGYMHVLSDEGELRWRYKASDQVHIVRAKDMNTDGNVEVAIGSGNQLTLLQIIDMTELNEHIELCFDNLKRRADIANSKSTIINLTTDENEYVRAFAFIRLAGQTKRTPEDFEILEAGMVDRSSVVRLEMVNAIATLCNAVQKDNPDIENVRQKVRSFLERLADSKEQELLLTLVNRLHILANVDSELCFEYLRRFLQSPDVWIRHAVIHQLVALLEFHPAQTWNLLLEAVEDEHEWIRQEVTYALARYFDLYDYQLDSKIYDMLSHRMHHSIIADIADVAKKPLVHDTLILLTFLLSTPLEEMAVSLPNYVKRTHAVDDSSEDLSHERSHIYRELSRLLQAPTIEQLETYRFDMDLEQGKNQYRFTSITRLFHRLMEVVGHLQMYRTQKEEQALFKAVSVLEEMSRNIQNSRFDSESEALIAENMIFAALLRRWREEMQIKLRPPEGMVKLIMEVHEITRQKEEQITFSVQLRNEGSRVARKVRVILEESSEENFKLINSNEHVLEEIRSTPPAPPQSVQFTIQLLSGAPVELLRLSFILIFNDFEEGQPLFEGFKKGQDQRRSFVDRVKVDEQSVTRIFTEIPTPYRSSEPIKSEDKKMFFGRKRELQELQEQLFQTDKVIVLSGQRRAGKTSLLHRLERLISEMNAYVYVYIDLNVYALKGSQGELFEAIAFSIKEQLEKKQDVDMPIMPDSEDFEQNPLPTLQQFLKNVVSALDNRQLLLLIDEFVVIERLIDESILNRDFLQLFFVQLKDFTHIKFLLAGTLTKHHFITDYWSAFINDVSTFYYPLSSKLASEDARQLINEPIKQFLQFDGRAISLIQQLTNNQPYLIHIMCEEIIRLCNKQHKEFVNTDDVNAAKESILKRGGTYLEWIRGSLNQTERMLLSALAQEQNNRQPALFSIHIKKRFDDLEIPYEEEGMLQARDTLNKDGIIETQHDSLYFSIPAGLLWEWLRREKPLEKVVRERFSQKLSY